MKRLLHGRIAQVEPVPQVVDAQHPLQAHRVATATSSGEVRLDERTQLRLRSHLAATRSLWQSDMSGAEV